MPAKKPAAKKKTAAKKSTAAPAKKKTAAAKKKTAAPAKKKTPAAPAKKKTTAAKKTPSKPKPTAASRITELAALLAKYKDAYYNGEPLVSDAAYDQLEDELRALAPEHPLLASVGAPVPSKPSASAAVTEWEKAQHKIPMGSLNKAVDEAEFKAWVDRCEEHAAKSKLPKVFDDLFVTEKLDGISLSVTYEDGVLTEAITRGDGQLGERITPNVSRMKGVPMRLAHKVNISARGEIILKLSDMKRSFPDASNARNMAAGTAKRFDGNGCEHLTVLFYDLEGEETDNEIQKFERLEQLGFETPNRYPSNLDGVVELYQEYSNSKRAAVDYEIDGLVIRCNRVRTQALLGELGGRPRAAVALKFASQTRVTKLNRIVWDTGDSGRVTPIAEFDRVWIGGAHLERATLHNVANVKALGISEGDEILVSRRNDVIPQVEEVVVKHGPPIVIPTTCGVCGSKLVTTGEFISCRNEECRAIVEGRIKNWVEAQDVHDFGEHIIGELVRSKLVTHPSDLYKLEVEDVAKLDRMGTISAKKILANLRAKLPLPLPLFLASLGIEHFALVTAKLIVRHGFDTLEKVRAVTVDELTKIPGLGPSKAKIVVEGLKARSEEIDRLLALGVVPTAPKHGGPLSGMSFCFTGALSKPRKEYEGMVEQHGGTLLSGVTKELNYLIMADPNSGSSKAEKAKKYGTKCIDEAEFLAIVSNATREQARAVPVDEPAKIPDVAPSKPKVVERPKARPAVAVVPVAPTAGGALAGMSFCFTGALSKPRKEYEELVEQHGGTLLSGVTKDLDYLIMADPNSGSSKAEKAKKYGTKCIDEAEFLAIVSNAAAN
jgi:DNA ligase (NAD+)